MTTITQLRKTVLALPEVEEGAHFGMVAFSVHGKGFASVTKDGDLQLQLPADDIEAACATHPSGGRLERMGKPIGFRIPLADIGGKDLNALVRASWAHRAPKRLVARLDTGAGSGARAGGSASGGSVADVASLGDLPAGIGKPATRALQLAGLTTLDQVATWSEKDLRALHGVGPKAVRILSEELRRRGQSLA